MDNSLKCDHCGKHLGVLIESDMEGNLVFCDECYAKIELGAPVRNATAS